MKQIGLAAMGPVPGSDWTEVIIPYEINRNERDVEEGDIHTVMPKWEMWDWLELNVPSLHDEDTDGNSLSQASWTRIPNRDMFMFYFEDASLAMRFKLTFV